jgi:hypothetical protein
MATTAPNSHRSADLEARQRHLDDLQRALVSMEVFLAIGAAGGSWGLISGSIDPSTYREHLPFRSPVLGGVALGLIVAVPAMIAAVATLAHLAWSRGMHPILGALLMGWIVVQICFIGLTSWLQPFMFLWGVAIQLLGWIDLRRGPA